VKPEGPIPAAYDAAETAALLAYADRNQMTDDILAQSWRHEHYAAVYARAGVDAVWPMAVAEGRRQAAADIREQGLPANIPVTTGMLPGGAGRLMAEWAARIAEADDA